MPICAWYVAMHALMFVLSHICLSLLELAVWFYDKFLMLFFPTIIMITYLAKLELIYDIEIILVCFKFGSHWMN